MSLLKIYIILFSNIMYICDYLHDIYKANKHIYNL